MAYTKAEDVRSPREHWALIQVLVDQGESPKEGEGRWSLAIGEWDGQRRLAARWNGRDDRLAGNPQSRGIATWFVLPPEFEKPLLESSIIPDDKLALAKALMNSR